MTFQWKLYRAMKRKTLLSAEMMRLDKQQQWMHSYVRSLAEEPPAYTHKKALAQLNVLFRDQLCPLFQQPMSELPFDRFKNGVTQRGQTMPHAVFRIVRSAIRVQYPKHDSFELPFDDVLSSWGHSGDYFRLRFRSNDGFRGTQRNLRDIEGHKQAALDARTGRTFDIADQVRSDKDLSRWLKEVGKGDVCYDDPRGGSELARRGSDHE